MELLHQTKLDQSCKKVIDALRFNQYIVVAFDENALLGFDTTNDFYQIQMDLKHKPLSLCTGNDDNLPDAKCFMLCKKGVMFGILDDFTLTKPINTFLAANKLLCCEQTN